MAPVFMFLGMSAEAASTAATVTAVSAIGAGTGLSAYSSFKEGKETVSSAKLERSILYKEAESVRQAGAYEGMLKAGEANQAQGEAIANIGASGSAITGSKLLGLVNNYVNFEADKRMIMRNAGLQASSLRMKGQLGVYQARKMRVASRIRAMAGLLQTAGQAAMMMPNNSGTPQATTSSGTAGKGVYKGMPAGKNGMQY